MERTPPVALARELATRLKDDPLASELLKRLEEQAALDDRIAQIESRLELGRMLDLVLDTLVGIAKAERGFIAFRREGGLEVKASRGRGELPGDLCDRAIATSKPVRQRDRLAVPIEIEGDVLGAAVLADASLTEDVESRAAAFVARVAGAVKRAVIVEEARGAMPPPPLRAILGHSPLLRRALEIIEKAAPTDAPILITGESGTGKELAARALHELSLRRGRAFLAINCAAVPETLLESDLFGHVKGAFTGATRDAVGKFEAADGGTIFLDEIGETSPALQARLLRVLQNGEIQPVGTPHPRRVNTRVVAATNRKLEELVPQGKFREDLYYRLNVVTVRLPSIRERREDLPALIRYFLGRYAAEQRKSVRAFDRASLERLLRHDYPGNVRELQNIIQHAVVMATGPVVTAADLPEAIRPGAAVPAIEIPVSADDLRRAKKQAREEVERLFLIEALRRSGGSVSKAALETGVHRTRLEQLLNRFGINQAQFKSDVLS